METYLWEKSNTDLIYRLKIASPLRLVIMHRSRVREVKYSLNDDKC